MAHVVYAESPPGFIEEIKYEEMKLGNTIGKGAFGVVYEAVYRQHPVAVKKIESENERRAFITELRQLSRVSHPNIIRLYGACSNPVSLVMELAECGSLYDLLHGAGPLPHYTGGHGMSWCLQCAKGVAYLHNMKPKALIHRDLKPPNLLLTNQGLVLKICDFGTACDIHTQMTNNKGSAAWMAPEVFEGCQYSERCDVFSWGIILWEVLTRRKPFDELGGPAFRIMWAVHTGTRPPLIQGCPKPIEELMTRCWSKNPSSRPSMNDVVYAMTELMPYFRGSDVPLVFPQYSDSDEESDYYETGSDRGYGTTYSTISDTLRKTHITNPNMTNHDRPPMVTSQSVPNIQRQEQLASSGSPLPDPTPLSYGNKFSTKRRSSSDLIAEIEKSPIERVSPSPVTSRSASPARPRASTSSPLITPAIHTPDSTASVTTLPPPAKPLIVPSPIARNSPLLIHDEEPGYDDYDYANDCTSPKDPNKSNSLPMSYLALELHLQPLPPTTSSSESMEIYEQHCRLAEEYLRVQTEIMFLQNRKELLTNELEKEEKHKVEGSKLVEEYQQLLKQNQELSQLTTKMKKEVEKARMKQKM
uniref:mitogen-activated protein kinase kinase kinase 7-like isoform X1 n=1 Tax=Styela clava TaxID=7725 RepID=UPI0019398CAF|nr:mitogen-activated protein kinase kinase kinase 7-like isoform X1 [Styela clava]